MTVYVPNTEGKLTLFKQQVIEKKDTGNGTVETTTVRFALPSDPGKLGPARKAEEVVCSGDCGRNQPWPKCISQPRPNNATMK